MPSSRMSTSLSLNTKNRSDGLLGAAPVGVGLQRTGMSSNWGSDSGMGMTSKVTSYATAPKIRSRVVVAKYDRKPMSSNTLFALAKPFGAIREHLVLNNKAFLELETHEEALAMANYYHRKPAILHGKEIKIYLSKELLVIEKARRPDKRTRQAMGVGDSKVVFFSNLPRGADQKMELLTISRRFGIVEKHLFLNDEAFVEMSNAEDAEMLVKYYTLHPLTIGKSSVRLNICAKYKTLTVPPGKGQGRVETTRRSSDSTSRTSDKSSSKSQRSSSSKAKESSDKKVEVSKQEDENEAKKEESGDEEADVMEARDGDEEDFVEEPSAEEEIQSCEPEESSTQPDPETNIEHEDSEEQQANDGTDDADAVEDQEETEEKQEEAQMEEPAVSETEQGENTDELPKQQPEEENGEQPQDEVPEEDDTQQEAQGEIDFPENLDEFVTLDELAEEEDAERHDSKSKAKNPSGSSKDKGGLRVVNVVGFKRGYGYLDEILSLAKPFGKVVRHLVLDVRPEAFLELSNEQEAKAMSNFYSGNVIPSVCGKPVKVYHSHTYPTIQSGRVVYIGNLPTFKSSDASLLKIAEPFGQVKRYFLNRLRNECFIEMEKGEDAEKMVETYKESPAKFEGKRLAVYISRKYKQLKHGHRPPSPESEDKRPSKRERSDETETQSNSSGKSNTKKEEEPSPKKSKVEKPTTDKHEEVDNKEEKESPNVLPETVPEVIKEDEEEQSKETPEVQKMETEPEAKDKEPVVTPPVAMSEKSLETEEKSAPPEKKPEISLATLGPHDPNVPVGVEFVKMGYYCRVCFLFYSNEDTAKRVHCCSQSHYDKLKKHLEKEKAKAQSNGGKK